MGAVGTEGGGKVADMGLDPDIAAQIRHLWGVSVLDVLAERVPGRPAARAIRRDDVVRTDDVAPGPDGPVPVRWYRPAGGDGVLPALVWVHGGGWRWGGLDMAEAESVAQIVAAAMPAAVVSVDYRLAPDHVHPAGVRDVRAVLDHVRDDADALGVDGRRVALGGGSAGAHLAALAVLEGQPERRPDALWLAYPVTDPVAGPFEDRHPECPAAIWTGRDVIGDMFDTYLGQGGPDRDDPRLAPTRHPALATLPSTLVTLAEIDGLRPQAVAFAAAARAAGVDVAVHEVDGVLHGYLDTVGEERLADAALERHIGWLREVLT